MIDRQKLIQSIRRTFGPREQTFTSLDALVNPQFPLSGGQRRAATRLLSKDNSSVNPDDLWTLRPNYLQPLAYLAFAPVFLLADDYELLGFGPERCGLCPEPIILGFDRFPEVVDMIETSQQDWFETYLLPHCTVAEVTVLRQYVEYYAQEEPERYSICAGKFAPS